ncbi:MAG: hypothetical protein H0X30_38575 [Anaerolineae bacterium]|nr:hypothetical protein [Anaerolineae bacterium]
MQFQTETLSLEVMLGAIQHFSWEQAYGLSTAVHNVLSALGIRSLPPIMMYISPSATSHSETPYQFPVPVGERLSVDRLEAALFNLDTNGLQTLNNALTTILRNTVPVNPNTIPKKTGTGLIQGAGIMIPSELIYPERDFSAIKSTYEQRTTKPQRDAHDLISQAKKAKQAGDLEICRNLADAAVRIIENSGEPSFEIRAERERVLSNSSNFDSKPIRAIWEEALDYYRQQGDDNKINHAIGQLVYFNSHDESDKQRTLDLIDEAIQITEGKGETSLFWRRQRNRIEQFGQPYDTAQNIKRELELMQEQLEYEIKNEIEASKILQTYLNLNAYCANLGDTQQAVNYLNEAEKYLDTITEDNIRKMAENSRLALSNYQIKYLLLLRAADIQQRRNNQISTTSS